MDNNENMLVVAEKDIETTLDKFNIDDQTKSSIIEELTKLSSQVIPKTDIGKDEIEEETESKADKQPAQKKQWALLISDPEHKISGEYTGWALQMNEDNNINDLEINIRAAASEFNDSKKGSRCPVTSIGESIMNIPAKFFKTKGVYIKNKEPVFVTITNNKLLVINNE